jgi:DNA-binding transcriptional LysR family regulator
MADNPLDQDALLRFLAVAEAGSFAGAARLLGVSRQAVHRSIDQLELVAGGPLIDRGSRDQHPTPLGRRLMPAARAVRDAMRAVSVMLTSTSEPAGLVRVTAPPLFGEVVLVPAIASLLRAWPAVSVDARFVTGRTDLHRDDYDLMIRIGAAPADDTYAVHLGEAGLVLCAAPALACEVSLTDPEQLSGLPLIGYGDTPAPTWSLVQGDATAVVQVTPRLTSNSARAATDAAIAGLGILRAPRLAVGPALQSGALVRVLDAWSVPAADVWAIYGHRSDTDPTLAALIEAVRAVPWS